MTTRHDGGNQALSDYLVLQWGNSFNSM